MKTLAFIARRADVTPGVFRDHYETIHAPLALPLLDGLQRYVRHHVRKRIVGSAGFDCMTSFWWSDSTAFGPLLARLESSAALRRDEESFMNRAENHFFPVLEGRLKASARRLAANLLVLTKRPPGAGFEEFLAGHRERSLPELISSAPEFCLCASDCALGGERNEARFDHVAALRCASDPAEVGLLRSWAESLKGIGVDVVVVAVSECESEIEKPRGGGS